MTEPDLATTDTPPPGPPKSKLGLIKGCGCTVAVVILALGILIIGNFDSGAWASALGAIVISILVYNLSGVNGMWEK
jgi:hypothetical protein